MAAEIESLIENGNCLARRRNVLIVRAGIFLYIAWIVKQEFLETPANIAAAYFNSRRREVPVLL
jgi:hypothetical protein